MLAFRPAAAYWNQRHVLAGARERILQLVDVVGRPTDLCPFQWAQLMAVAMEFAPDLILELGRGCGNSTAAFTESSHLTGGRARVNSICMSSDWDRRVAANVRTVVGDEWFGSLTTVTTDILEFDFASALNDKNAARILLFWDAHGFDIAECVLGKILPMIATRPHLVIMHDLSDSRYAGLDSGGYNQQRIWRGGTSGIGPRVRLGDIDSAVEQSVAALDFASRNRLTLDSADHSFHAELTPAQVTEMETLLGPMFNRSAHWFYFSLNEHAGPYFFPEPPTYTRKSAVEKITVAQVPPPPPIPEEFSVLGHLRAAVRQSGAAVLRMFSGSPAR